ncbi:MAG: hypothetical protein WCY92_00480 [Novosphingobium sp.]
MRKVTLDARWFYAMARPFTARKRRAQAEIAMHISGVLRQPAGMASAAEMTGQGEG